MLPVNVMEKPFFFSVEGTLLSDFLKICPQKNKKSFNEYFVFCCNHFLTVSQQQEKTFTINSASKTNGKHPKAGIRECYCHFAINT